MEKDPVGELTRLFMALRLTGAADTSTLVARTGLPSSEVDRMLLEASEGSLVRRGRGENWSLTPEGRRRGEALLAEDLEGVGDTGAVRRAYEELMRVNATLLEICTRWQLRKLDGEYVPNDHSDPEHDEKVVVDLEALNRSAQGILLALESVPTFEGYRFRLSNALARVQAGAVDYVLSPRLDSYHQVWFELHEHLLAALGLDRASEAERVQTGNGGGSEKPELDAVATESAASGTSPGDGDEQEA